MAGNIPQESPYICMGMCLWEAAEPTNTRASATPTMPTQPGFNKPHSSPRPAFSTACRLLAGTHGAAQPTRRQQPQLARAPAGHRSPIERRTFRPVNGDPPPLEPPSPRPRVRAGSAEHTDALRSPSTAGQPCISAREALRKCTISRPENPPTSSTCSTATQRSPSIVSAMGRWVEVLRALPYQSESLQQPCSGRNGKPFRAPPTARAL